MIVLKYLKVRIQLKLMKKICTTTKKNIALEYYEPYYVGQTKFGNEYIIMKNNKPLIIITNPGFIIQTKENNFVFTEESDDATHTRRR